MKWKWMIISGTCKCGHSWEDHHLGCIMNPRTLEELRKINPDHPPYLPQECEYYGCNEDGGLDSEGNKHCFGYIDKDAPNE